MIIQQSIRLSMLLFLAVVSLTSCERFYPDPLDPRLPIYSETGKNQVGAIINGSVYVDYPRPSFLSDNPNESSIFLFGRDSLYVSLRMYSKSRGGHLIYFELKDLSADSWREMGIGNGKKFRIDNNKLKISMPNASDWERPNVEFVEGNLTLKHIPGLKVMAGTFGFTLRTSDQKTYNVHYGRFDLFYSDLQQ